MSGGDPTSSRSTPLAVTASRVDWTKLSQEDRAILRTIGLLIFSGYSETEIAARTGLRPLEVRTRTRRLQEAIADAAGVELPKQPLLVTTDELIEMLPATKTPAVWKGWIRGRAHRGEVPGAVKVKGAWHFDAEKTLAWIEEAELER